MPASTPCANIPYPVASDPPNFAGDMQALALGVDNAVCAVQGLPVGAIVPWYQPSGGGQTLPAGMLYCDGAAFNTSTYPALQSHLGTNTTPNLEGMFLRGRGGAYPGYGQVAGSDNATLPTHKHTMPTHQHTMAHGHTGSTVTGNGSHAHGPQNQHSSVAESFMYRITPNLQHPNVVNMDPNGVGLAAMWGSTTTATATHTHGVSVKALTTSSKTGSIDPGDTRDQGSSGTNKNLPRFTNVTYLIVAA